MKEPRKWVNPERLVALLVQQRDLYRDLGRLSRHQRDLISDDRPDALLNLLKERQSVVLSLARLNEQLAPFRRNWDGVYEQLPQASRDQANELLREINQMLTVILAADQEDGALLSARRQSIGAEIKQVSGGREANAAYARPARLGESTADIQG